MSLEKIINEFEKLQNNLFGLYFDSIEGYKLFNKSLIEDQKNTINQFKISDPELANFEYLDTTYFFYGLGHPNDPNHHLFHKSTQAEVKQRISKNGSNGMFIGNMVIVVIYQYWDEFYRREIAKALNIRSNDIKVPLFGDLKTFRKSIIHHKGIALKEVENCKIYRWFKEGDTISINEEKMQTIFKDLSYFLQTLKGIDIEELKSNIKLAKANAK